MPEGKKYVVCDRHVDGRRRSSMTIISDRRFCSTADCLKWCDLTSDLRVCSHRIFLNRKYREARYEAWIGLTLLCSMPVANFEVLSWQQVGNTVEQSKVNPAHSILGFRRQPVVQNSSSTSSASQFQECKKTFEGSASFYSVDDQPCCGPCAGVEA